MRGRVQGVFFRDACSQAATERGVAGWVTNNVDGTVEAVFEGATDDVNAMCDWCKNGPSHADVDSVEVSEEDPVGEEGFSVR